MKPIISGIQQVGIGVSNAEEAFCWYRKIFGTDIVVFKDAATASLMQQYTGNKPHNRFAILAMNLQGGGGFEIWQYTSRTPVSAIHQIQLGDLGIYSVKIKAKDVSAIYKYYLQENVKLLSMPSKNPAGLEHFYLQDPYGNVFEVVEDHNWFSTNKHPTGSVCGITIGVSSIEKSLAFYQSILGYDKCIYEGEGQFDDWKDLAGGSHNFKRVLVGHTRKQSGAFSKLLGPTYIELVEVTDRKPEKIYNNRYWGDLGFIHVCYDINGMEAHEQACFDYGHSLTVNSRNSFDMGKAAGHFAYNEDPDGTLIEYVETHKVPVIKKLGLYLNLKKRKPERPLPDWMVRCLSFSRVKG
jgi:catechol 2,3-dioxygenase-like lactoylglutathione lyase family enzyme